MVSRVYDDPDEPYGSASAEPYGSAKPRPLRTRIYELTLIWLSLFEPDLIWLSLGYHLVITWLSQGYHRPTFVRAGPYGSVIIPSWTLRVRYHQPSRTLRVRQAVSS